MAYAFDITEGVVKDENADGDEEGDDLVSDDEDEKTILSMVPLADILNADADKNNARLYCENDAVLEMRTLRLVTSL